MTSATVWVARAVRICVINRPARAAVVGKARAKRSGRGRWRLQPPGARAELPCCALNGAPQEATAASRQRAQAPTASTAAWRHAAAGRERESPQLALTLQARRPRRV